MNELLEILRAKLGPGGDLYLTKTHAEHLFRWIEITGNQLNEHADRLMAAELALELNRLAKLKQEE